jgi:diguanylate cyclase (GGDEF)-like protein
VVALDLDGMKSLNDTCGHPTGDAALCTVAEVLRASLRSVDHAARLGGDEFGIVMPATNAPAAAQVAERIRNRIEQLLLPRGLRLSASFGVAADERPQRGATGFNLVARADAALYAAKRDGKNRVVTEPTTKQTEAA